MLLYGPGSFPPAGQTMPVFTSRNDNNCGEVIQGVPGEANRNGDPSVFPFCLGLFPLASRNRPSRQFLSLRRSFSDSSAGGVLLLFRRVRQR